jgi:hypothetical protein
VSVKTFSIHGTGDGKKVGWFFDWYNQWPGIFSRDSNWYDFTLVHFTFEYAPYKSCFELQVALLGLSATVTYVFKPVLGDEE